MTKQNISALFLTIIFAGFVYAAKGQRYVKDYLTHKVIVNQVDHSIVAYVKPIKRISLDTDRRYYWFAHNEVNSTQGGFSGKLLNGSYQEFYANKQLKESGYLKKGLKTGVWKKWNEDGSLSDDCNWKLGRMNGVYHKYDSTGNPREVGQYKNDLKQGKQKSFTPDGVKELFYKKGKVTARKKIPMPNFMRKIFNKKPKTM